MSALLAAAASIVLAFEGLEDRGQVMVALYGSEADYASRASPVAQLVVPVRQGRAEAVFPGLPAGDYAALAFHDRNGDRKMNFRLGLPAEPFGASNNARGLPVAPWKAARFQARDGTTRQSLRLR